MSREALRDGLVAVMIIVLALAFLALFGCAAAPAACDGIDAEFCDGRDNDCDGDVDEEALDAWVLCLDDVDGIRDGVGDPATRIESCSTPTEGGSWVTDCGGER